MYVYSRAVFHTFTCYRYPDDVGGDDDTQDRTTEEDAEEIETNDDSREAIATESALFRDDEGTLPDDLDIPSSEDEEDDDADDELLPCVFPFTCMNLSVHVHVRISFCMCTEL